MQFIKKPVCKFEMLKIHINETEPEKSTNNTLNDMFKMTELFFFFQDAHSIPNTPVQKHYKNQCNL